MSNAAILSLLNQETTQQEQLAIIAYFLSAMLEKMPRLDAQDRVTVSTGDQGNVTVALAGNQVIREDVMGGTSQVTDLVPQSINRMASAVALYSNITYTP